ncbi:related to integral membrane protein [Phialocephala subalpina]|uniref:Related to integral membrane protein n=1 Tax=Phialocephala subalpina TaxID=576137 RepID=A0A1L7WF70_9HELO|nr:related to integral membrane protein [Phialocephala subalpina]
MDPNTSGQDLSQNKQSNLRSTNIALVVLAGFFVGLRFLSRWKKRAYIGIDDYFIILAYVFLLALLSIGLLMIYYGLGVHAASVDINQHIAIGKCLIAFGCIYVTTVAITKVSLLLMYCRIFPVRSIRIGCWILGALSIGWCISIIVISIFQCTPIAKAWNPTIPGHCVNLKGEFIGNAVPNILTDIAILSLPMPSVWHLHTAIIQRCQLSIVFLLGSFVVFTSIYRFKTLFEFEPSDLTWTLADSGTWVIVECSAGIISACLPTLAPLLRSINFMPWRKDKPPSTSFSRNVNEIITIGGSGARDRRKRSRFERLDESVLRDEDLRPDHGAKLAIGVYYGDSRGKGDAESQASGDEIPLKGIQTRMEVEPSEPSRQAGRTVDP